MSCILHIETSTDVCSVALSHEGLCLNDWTEREGRRAANVLGGMVEEAIGLAESRALPIDAVAVSMGPGSYTGLRIGASMAKGIAYGRNARLITISTLELLCTPVLLNDDEMPDDALLCPMIDARRMEVYAGIYDRALKTVREVRAEIVNEDSYAEWLDRGPVYFFGCGAEKCRKVLKHPNARFITDVKPEARYMLPLAERAVALNDFADVAYFEPFYLKAFVAGISKHKVI